MVLLSQPFEDKSAFYGFRSFMFPAHWAGSPSSSSTSSWGWSSAPSSASPTPERLLTGWTPLNLYMFPSIKLQLQQLCLLLRLYLLVQLFGGVRVAEFSSRLSPAERKNTLKDFQKGNIQLWVWDSAGRESSTTHLFIHTQLMNASPWQQHPVVGELCVIPPSVYHPNQSLTFYSSS